MGSVSVSVVRGGSGMLVALIECAVFGLRCEIAVADGEACVSKIMVSLALGGNADLCMSVRAVFEGSAACMGDSSVCPEVECLWS